MKFITNLDWLQVFCLGDALTTNVVTLKNLKYKAKDTGKETMQFQKLYYIYRNGFKVAEIQQEPRTRVINKRATIVKIDNQILYTTLYTEILYEILEAYTLDYKGITRIDVCLDCQTLYNDKDVQEFLRQCVGLQENQKGYIYNVRRTHCDFHTSRTANFGCRINSVKWGSPISRISCYCYDKTLELAEKKDKPWIRQVWERNGIDYQYTSEEIFEWGKEKDKKLAKANERKKKRMIEKHGLADWIKKPVWRFEISIKGQGKQLLMEDTGEIFNLSLDEIANQRAIQILFFSYAKNCFVFRQNTGQVDRYNFKPLQIFDWGGETIWKPKYVSYKQQTGKSEKACYNKLAKELQNVSEDDAETQKAFARVMEWMQQQANLNIMMYDKRKWMQSLAGVRAHQWVEEVANTFALLNEKIHWLSDVKSHNIIDVIKDLPVMQGKEVPKWMLDEEFWLSLDDFRQSLQSSNIVIPEGAERLSECEISNVQPEIQETL